jgi:hypothetical protein
MKRRTIILSGILVVALLAIGALIPYILLGSEPTLEERRAAKFTTSELELLERLAESTNSIHIGHIPDTPPIDFREGNAIRDGITWSYVDYVSRVLGVRFQRVRCDNWEEDLLNHTIDIIMSVAYWVCASSACVATTGKRTCSTTLSTSLDRFRKPRTARPNSTFPSPT